MPPQSNCPTVTFVVPCYNYGRYLGECLESIFSQEGEHDFEVIAIDDASTDNTPKVLRRYAGQRLRVVTHARNAGHVATITEGLHLARGAFVARIDPDDRYRPHFLAATLRVFRKHPDIGMVYGDVALIDERGTTTQQHVDRVHGGHDFKGNELLRLLEENYICAPSVIARREAWLSALPVPDHLAFNDWYFTLMMARRHDFYFVNCVLAEYRVHHSNHHSAIARDRSEEPSILWLLDRIFSEREADPLLETQKQQSRRRVYASHYRVLGERYFGLAMDSDARRCYLRAIRYRPRIMMQATVMRHLVGTVIGRRGYVSARRLVICLVANRRRSPRVDI